MSYLVVLFVLACWYGVYRDACIRRIQGEVNLSALRRNLKLWKYNLGAILHCFFSSFLTLSFYEMRRVKIYF